MGENKGENKKELGGEKGGEYEGIRGRKNRGRIRRN